MKSRLFGCFFRERSIKKKEANIESNINSPRPDKVIAISKSKDIVGDIIASRKSKDIIIDSDEKTEYKAMPPTN